MLRLILAAALLMQAPASPPFDSNKAWEHLRQLVALGPRPAGSAAIEQSRAYIKKQLTASGIAVAEQAWDDQTPTGRVHMVNLIATIPGTSKNRLVIGGHYDTKKFPFRFVGANDGGSSAAFLIELGRALKGRTNRVPIELLFLDGEEAVGEWQGTDHTYGSRYYVEAARQSGTLGSIRAFVLVDMIGDRNLVIKREANSTPALTEAIWAAAKKLNRREFVAEITPIEDDHIEFLAAGVPSVDIIDLEYPDLTSRFWHTQYDTIENVAASSLQAVGDVLLAALPALETIDARRGR